MQKHNIRFLSVIFATLLIQGCTMTSGQKRDVTESEVDTKPPLELYEPGSAVERIDPDVVYYVGAAEIAGRRQMHQQASVYYLKAAMLSKDPGIAQRAVQVAVYANAEGEVMAAVSRWLELAPMDPEAHRMSAIITLRAGEMETAWTNIETMLSLLNTNEVWDNIVKLLTASPNKNDARELLSRLTQNHTPPQNLEVLTGLSDLAVTLGEIEMAAHYATLALEVDPENAANYNWRGRLRTSLNLFEEARSDFARAVELDPENTEMRQTYAVLLAELGDYAAALEQLEQVDDTVNILYSKALYASASEDAELAESYYVDLQNLEVSDEESNEKFFFLGQLSETLEKPIQESIDWLKQVRSGDRMEDARLRTAILLGQDDQLSQARFILQKLQNGNAETAARAFRVEAGLLENDGDSEESMKVLDRAVSMLGDNTDVLYTRAMLAERMDMIEVTEQDLTRILELLPDDPNALNALGYTLADRSIRLDEALNMIERAYAQRPDSAAITDSMGWVHYRLGKYEDAREYLQKALSLQEDSEIIAHLGEVLWVIGDHEKAQEVWQQGLDKDPESAVILETRDRLKN